MNRYKRRGRIFWGVVVLGLAAAVICQLCGLFDWDMVSWRLAWPFIPALLSFAGLVSGGLNTWNFGVFGVSAWLLLCNYGVIRVEHGIALGFAIFFAVLGIGLIVSAFLPDRRRGGRQPAAPVETRGGARESAVFDDVHFICAEQEFTGGRYSTVFGDATIDLRSAAIRDGAVLEASCVFGDVRILLPAGCRVQVQGSRVFGDVRMNASLPTDETLPLLYIRHSVVFGDVQIL